MPLHERRTVLEVRQLAKTFTLHLRGGAELPVLRGLSLTVRRGECVALPGASGGGKCTLLKCLYGNYGADAGEMLLRTDGGWIDLARAAPQRWLAVRRRHMAYVSQFLRVMPRVSALDVVAERAEADHGWARSADERVQQARSPRPSALRRCCSASTCRPRVAAAAGHVFRRRAAAHQHRARLHRAVAPAAARRAHRVARCRQPPRRGRR